MAKAKSSKNFFGFYGIAESLGKLWFKGRKQSKNFFKILRFCALRVRFYGIVESTRWILRNCGIYKVDSAELWNRWWIGVGKGKRTLLFAKAKSSKSF